MFKNQLIIQEALNKRNFRLADYWFSNPSERIQPKPYLIDCSALIIDAKDSFTEMLSQQLRAIGLQVTLRESHEPTLLDGNWDLIVMGPGPGDPRNNNDQRIAIMRKTMRSLLATKRPFLAVCLSHQILCLELGFELIRRKEPNQGVQREINFFGRSEWVGFYNTYVAKSTQTLLQQLKAQQIEVSFDTKNNEVHALRGHNFVAVQFHPESLLTHNGINIIASSLEGIMKK